MNLNKIAITLLVALLVVVATFLTNVTRAQQIFADVPTQHANYADIQYLVEHDVVSATNKEYGVGDIVTREEVAVMVAKALKLDGTPRETKFSDVPSSNPNSGYIQSAVEAGIINGYPNGKFQPKTKVTRGHVATFIARAFDLPNGTKVFKDVKAGSTSFKAVSQLAAANITTGYTDGTFKPSLNLSRAHISAFLTRAMKYQEKFEDPATQLNVHYINVGQGDATLIQAPNGKTMLIDGGTKDYGDDVVAYLKALNITKLDYVVATHPDADHIGGLIEVVNTFQVGQFINSGKMHTTETYEHLLTAVINQNIAYVEPKVGQTIPLNRSMKLQVLAVDAGASENNDASIVLKLTYNKITFLFMADAGTKIESDIAKKYNINATVLKAGHHGSRTSSSRSFLQKVKPEAVILSYGQYNDYGHPHEKVVKNIKAVGAKIYSIATLGTIIAKTDGKALAIISSPFDITQPYPTISGEIETTPSEEETSGYYVIPGAPTMFENCDLMRKYYPNGVHQSHPAYAAARDGDKDGWACEK